MPAAIKHRLPASHPLEFPGGGLSRQHLQAHCRLQNANVVVCSSEAHPLVLRRMPRSIGCLHDKAKQQHAKTSLQAAQAAAYNTSCLQLLQPPAHNNKC